MPRPTWSTRSYDLVGFQGGAMTSAADRSRSGRRAERDVKSIVPWLDHSLSVLIPAFNAARSLEATVDRLLRALNVSVEDFEILIVDDGSSDGTGVAADRLAEQYSQVRVFHNPSHTGLG